MTVNDGRLSDKQVELLTLAAEGRPRKEIARRLGVSVWTVSYQCGLIYKTLGCDGSRQRLGHAIDLAREKGLIPQEP